MGFSTVRRRKSGGARGGLVKQIDQIALIYGNMWQNMVNMERNFTQITQDFRSKTPSCKMQK
jgi:hypothetical protein